MLSFYDAVGHTRQGVHHCWAWSCGASTHPTSHLIDSLLVQGLRWMVALHDYGLSGILADDMGLGDMGV